MKFITHLVFCSLCR